jgi:ElaA protein
VAEPSVIDAAGAALTAPQLHALLKLRVDVFVVEQQCPYPEIDGVDLLPTTRHFWVEDGGRAIACLRLLAGDDGVLRIGRVCTSPSARGSGLAGKLMRAAVDRVGESESVLSAQTTAADFYRRFGYVPEGEPYDEDGIEHITMRRKAAQP